MLAFLATLLLVFLLYKMSGGSKADGPEILLDVGRMRGKTLTLSDGFQMDVFYAVPFAESPTEERRFEASLLRILLCFIVHGLQKPVPKKAWTGVLEATELKPLCFPIIGDPNDPLFTEDCLYMNVYRPHKVGSFSYSYFYLFGLRSTLSFRSCSSCTAEPIQREPREDTRTPKKRGGSSWPRG